MSQPTVFISYSRKDEKEKEELLSHLGVLRNAGLIDLWSDDRIRPGSDWEQEIHQAISQASVAVLLISANFLNSEFILSQHIPLLLRRREREGLIVFPIIAKACAWKTMGWLAKMRVRPSHEEPIWREGGIHADEELAVIAGEIANIITAKAKEGTETGGKVVKQSVSSPAPVADRSGQYHSCFISYSHRDEDFARQLHDDLEQAGVECWFAPDDMKIGDKIRQAIENSIHAHSKLLLILSKHSIESDWVAGEAETVFEIEREHKDMVILFPIRLDEAVMDTKEAWAAHIRRTRHMGDFRQWQDGQAYQQAFQRVLRDLKKS